jgi:tripartite-type tricarboxylate transporter receptor subunit TctC
LLFRLNKLIPTLAALCIGAFLLASPWAAAQEKPLKIIVGAPPGGTTDTLARTIGQTMGEALKRTVIVENRAGAGGNIAADFVAKSNPDGDTILMSFTSHTINATLYKKLPFDPLLDFTPITMVATVPSVLIAARKVPVNNVAELIAYARAHPGQLNFALGAVGSSLHMAGDQFKMMAGLDIVNIPYKGTGPALTDLLAGQTDLMFASTINVQPHLKNDRIKILGVTSASPLANFPGVPPIGQTLKGFESTAWFGLFGPAKMSPAVTQRLYQAAKAAVVDPAFRQRLANEGAKPMTMEPAQFANFLTQDVQHWAKIIAFSGATLE